MMAIAKASLRSMLRNPSTVIFSLGFPLVFIVVFGFISGSRLKLEVGIDSSCDTSNAVYRSFSQMPNIVLVKDKGRTEMNNLLTKGRIDALVYVHAKEKSDSAQVVEVIISKASREKGVFIESILNNIVDKQNIAVYHSLSKEMDSLSMERSKNAGSLVQLKKTETEGREYKMIDFILPGQLGFSILSAGVFGTAFVFFSLRQTLVLKRFFATPISRTHIILGETLSRLVFQLAGALIIILLGHYLYGFTLIHGLWTVLELLLLSAIGLLVFMGFGFVVSGIAKSESVIPPLANVITMPQFLLSGTFFSIDAFPSWLQVICKALPLTYLNDALRKVAFEGAGMLDIGHELLVIGIWGVVVYAAAVRFFRWE